MSADLTAARDELPYDRVVLGEDWPRTGSLVEGGRGVSVDDLDGDGHLDLFVPQFMSASRFLFGDGAGGFEDRSEVAHPEGIRDARLLFHAADGVIRSDRLLTIPSVVALTLTGISTAIVGHMPLLHTPWILGALILFTISGVTFSLRVIPLQRQMREIAKTGMETGEFSYEVYARVARGWEFWGGLALLLPLGALVLMVLKPVR